MQVTTYQPPPPPPPFLHIVSFPSPSLSSSHHSKVSLPSLPAPYFSPALLPLSSFSLPSSLPSPLFNPPPPFSHWGRIHHQPSPAIDATKFRITSPPFLKGMNQIEDTQINNISILSQGINTHGTDKTEMKVLSA